MRSTMKRRLICLLAAITLFIQLGAEAAVKSGHYSHPCPPRAGAR